MVHQQLFAYYEVDRRKSLQEDVLLTYGEGGGKAHAADLQLKPALGFGSNPRI